MQIKKRNTKVSVFSSKYDQTLSIQGDPSIFCHTIEYLIITTTQVHFDFTYLPNVLKMKVNSVYIGIIN